MFIRDKDLNDLFGNGETSGLFIEHETTGENNNQLGQYQIVNDQKDVYYVSDCYYQNEDDIKKEIVNEVVVAMQILEKSILLEESLGKIKYLSEEDTRFSKYSDWLINYAQQAQSIIDREGKWPGEIGDVEIINNLIKDEKTKFHDVILMLQTQSPEIAGKDLTFINKYINQVASVASNQSDKELERKEESYSEWEKSQITKIKESKDLSEIRGAEPSPIIYNAYAKEVLKETNGSWIFGEMDNRIAGMMFKKTNYPPSTIRDILKNSPELLNKDRSQKLQIASAIVNKVEKGIGRERHRSMSME